MITIMNEIESNIENSEYVLRELKKLLIPTILEKGCIQYDLYIDVNHTNKFLLFEVWQTKQLYQEHMNNIHVLQYIRNTNNVVKMQDSKEMCLVK